MLWGSGFVCCFRILGFQGLASRFSRNSNRALGLGEGFLYMAVASSRHPQLKHTPS